MSARADPRGGRSAMVVPTATALILPAAPFNVAQKPCRLRDSKVSSLLAFPSLGAYGITGDHLISGSGVCRSKTTVVIECIPSDEAGIFRVHSR
jgi:hypothetical protein